MACILLIDDDREIRDILRDVLKAEGHDVVSAADGLEALRMLEQGPRPCLILLDLMMPVFDGWQFLAQRSQNPALADIPVVVITASRHAPSGLASQTKVLKKPFALDDLLESVREYC